MKPSRLLLPLLALGCGASVTPAPAAPADAGAPVVEDAPTVVTPAPTCAEVRASCGAEPEQFVRGHAEGLVGLDGARVRFAMRYLRDDGQGLGVPHGVVVGSAVVRDGAFEACVCMPRGGSNYPQVTAVVFAPGTTGETSRDVARATFSQRYATLGDESLSYALGGVPSAPEVEAALAGLVDRGHQVVLRGVDPSTEGAQAFGGLVADERPVAADVTGGQVEGGALAFAWNMPGREWPTERLALVIDRNGNRRCDEGDLGAVVRLDGRRELSGVGAWAQGAAVGEVCRALSLESGRER